MDDRRARNRAHLDTDGLGGSIRRRSVQGGVMLLLAQVAKTGIGVVGIAVLARLLTPRDFGLLAMVTTLTRLVDLFTDLGLAMATIQRKTINQDEVSFLFWTNLALGALVSLVTLAAAPLLAWFYGEPILTPITCALASAFVMTATGVQHGALLRRQLRLQSLAGARIVAAFLSTCVGVGAAVWGMGYWSLVASNLSAALILTVILWGMCDWRPSWPGPRPESWRSLLRFGGHITGSRVAAFLGRNLDNVLIGKVWGDEALAFYIKAYQLLMLPVQQLIGPLGDVVIPALSRLQGNPDAFQAFYYRTLRVLSLVTMPVTVGLAVASDEVILLVLGPQWHRASAIFLFLVPAAFVNTLNGASGWIWISLNQTDRQLRWAMAVLPVTLLSFAIGVVWGPEGVAVAFSIVQVTLRYVGLSYCYRGVPFMHLRDLRAAMWRPAFASITAGAAVLALGLTLGPHPNLLVQLFAKALSYTVLYLLLLLCVPGGRSALTEVAALLKEFRAARA